MTKEDQERVALDAYERALCASLYYGMHPQMFYVFAFIGVAILRLNADPTLTRDPP